MTAEFAPDRVWKKACDVLIRPSCTYCGGFDGHSELVQTGDTESLEGWEVWFCCHPCRDKQMPCETFHNIPTEKD